MYTKPRFSPSNFMRALTVVVFAGVLGVSASHAQEATAPKTVLDFEGSKIFSKQELLEVANKCRAGFSKSEDENETLDYCLHRVRQFLAARGYLQAQLGKPRQEQTENGPRTIVSVNEGALFRLGEVEIKGTRTLSPTQIREMFELKTGDIADSQRIAVWLFERVKKAYGNLGYIQYTVEVQPKFHRKDGAEEGVADLEVTIDEGNAFTIASIQFVGNENVSKDVLLREMTVRNGEVFSQELLDSSLIRINQSGQFETIDADKDVYYEVDKKAPRLNLTIHLKKRVAESTPLPRPIGRVSSIQPIPERE
jgi:outer membrane protein insertion porin family